MKFWGSFQNTGFKDLDALITWLTPGLTSLAQIVTGNVTFADNIRCSIATVQLSTNETAVPHSLGSIPIGFLVLNLDAAVTIYSGTSPYNTNFIYLKSTGLVNAKIAVIGG